MSVEVLQAGAIRVSHGFMGRRGGVSTGGMAGLNVGPGSGDDPEILRENQQRAINAVLPGASLLLVHQTHSADVVTASEPWPMDRRPPADALVTDRPGLLLGILTADCAPVLFADGEAGVIGAAHAGWRGAFAGVTDATIEAMEELGARRERIAAAVGPSIAQANYEVDETFRERFLDQSAENARYFSEETAKPHFDLEAYVVARLSAAGLRQIEALGEDTYGQPERFFSFRRSTHRGESVYGRQVSLIGLP